MSSAEPAVTSRPPALTTRRVASVLLAVGLFFVALYAVGLVPRIRERTRLAAEAQAQRDRLPMVATTRPHRAPVGLELPLPGNAQAIL